MTTLIELRQRAQTELEGLRSGKTCISVDTGFLGAGAGSLAVAEQIAAEAARSGIDLKFTAMGSLGWREVEPLVAIAKPGSPRTYYPNVNPALVLELVASLAGGGEVCPDLALAVDGRESFAGLPALASLPFFAGQKRVAMRRVGIVDPEDLNDALVHGAYAGLARALDLTPDAVIDKIDGVGLRARAAGGPVARRWRECRQAPAGEHHLIANAAYGFEQSGPYDLLLEGDPHGVLEGILIAAYAVGAEHVYLCIGAGSDVAIRRASHALEQLRAAGLAGNNILGSGFCCEIEIRTLLRQLNAAEDTILIAAVEGRQAHARTRPPAPEIEGLFGKPTVVQDVETLALAAAILAGTADSPEDYQETMIVNLDGALARTGFVEVPVGTPIRTVVEQVGGGPASERGLKAVQIGGPAGGWIPAAHLDVALDNEELLKAGCTLDSGAIFAAAGDCCAVDLARRAAAAAHMSSCGKCTFGREGTRQLKDVLTDITKGRGLPGDIDLLLNISDGMKAGSMCANGRNAPDAVLTTLRHFRSEYEAHLSGAHCPADACGTLTKAGIEKVAR